MNKKFIAILSGAVIVVIVVLLASFGYKKESTNETTVTESTDDYVVDPEVNDTSKSSVPDPVRMSLQVYDEVGLPSVLVDRIYQDLLKTDITGDVRITSSNFNMDTYVFKYKGYTKDYSEYKSEKLHIVNTAGISEDMVSRLKSYLNLRDIYGNIEIVEYDQSTYTLKILVDGEEMSIEHWGQPTE